MKRIIIIFLAIVLPSVLLANIYVRYNQAGYFPTKEKKLIILSDANIYGNRWNIKNSYGTIVLEGYIPQSSQGVTAYTTKAYNYVIGFTEIQTAGIYSFNLENTKLINFKITGNPYDAFPQDILSTIRARRSGSNDAIVHAYSHGKDSSCYIYTRTNANNAQWAKRPDNKKANMIGGWYDAGDYIKFTETTAYTTYLLLKSYQNNPQLFNNKKEFSTTNLNDLLDEAQFGLTYLMKTMPEAGIFIIQTGGYLDHEQGFRLPENDLLEGSRECYSALSKPQMGLTAAALALGSQIFEDLGYSAQALEYKNKAIEIYTAAKASTEPNAWYKDADNEFYADLTENDNLELAAAELYRLTQQNSYLDDAKSFGTLADQAYWTSWGDNNMLAHTVLYPDYTSIGAPLIADLTYFNQIRNRTNNIWKAPHESTWGTLYSYFEVANAAMEYQKLSNSTTYEPLVLDVLNYFYGQNPWGLSFIASEDLPKSITSTYAVMYRLQPQIFPRGEIAEGPTTADEHLANEEWFDPIHNPNLWHKEFNSPDFTFFEEPGDYVCMETTISGLADGLFLLATAIQMYNESEIIEIPNPIQILDLEASTKDHKILYTFSCPTSSTAKVIIYNSQGIAIHAENYTSGNQISDEVEVPHGFYIVELKIGASIESKKIIVR